jgi:hypothetical protein
LVRKFLLEKPGTGTGLGCSKYQYIVDQSLDGATIYLIRPAGLNNGIDFIIHLSGFNFKTHKSNGHRLPEAQKTNPSYKDIIEILKHFKNEKKNEYRLISENIVRTYKCEDIKYIAKMSKIRIFHKSAQNYISAETICLVIKWLFIEQDLTYWNYSGRAMFLKALKDEKLI